MVYEISRNESPQPTFRQVFFCWTNTCIKKTLEALGFEHLVEKIKVARYPVKIVITDVTDFLCEDSCSASLVSITESTRVYGKAEEVDVRQEVYSCGPDMYKVDCYKYRLQPGTLVHHFVRGYTGDRNEDEDTIYINPINKKVEVKNDKLIVYD